MPRAADAMRWSPDAWPEGGTLVWHAVDHPKWAPAFANAEAALPLVERALDAWSAIPTADVRWRVDGVILDETTGGNDGRNTIFIDEEIGGGYAIVWQRGDQIIECDIGVEIPRPKLLEPDSGSPFAVDLLSILIHELGHCSALGHSPASPTTRWLDASWTRSFVGSRNPQMAFGPVPFGFLITVDDATGASLLRPRSGWRQTTGSVSGNVRLGGRAAPFVAVSLMRTDDGDARPGVHGVTDEDGVFVVEGLAPGEYLLWIHPMFPPYANQEFIDRTVIDFHDFVTPHLIPVREGEETEAGEFLLRAGRL